MQVQEWLIEREQLLGRIKELKTENAELRKRLGKDITPIEKKPTAMQNLSLKEKVDLFIGAPDKPCGEDARMLTQNCR